MQEKLMNIVNELKKIDVNEFHRFVVDDALLQDPEEQGYLGYAQREPGSLPGMLRGFRFVLRDINETSITSEFIQNIHLVATLGTKKMNVASRPGQIRQKSDEVSFRLSLDNNASVAGLDALKKLINSEEKDGNERAIAIVNQSYSSGFTSQELFNIAIRRIKNTELSSEEILKQPDKKSCVIYRAPCAIKIDNYLKKICEEYNRAIKKAPDDDTKLQIIVNCIQQIEQLHPFYDGNCRTSYLLLQRLLIQNGFLPCMIYDPNYFDGFSVEELVKTVKIGIEKTKETIAKSQTPDNLSLNKLAGETSPLIKAVEREQLLLSQFVRNDLNIPLEYKASLNIDPIVIKTINDLIVMGSSGSSLKKLTSNDLVIKAIQDGVLLEEDFLNLSLSDILNLYGEQEKLIRELKIDLSALDDMTNEEMTNIVPFIDLINRGYCTVADVKDVYYWQREAILQPACKKALEDRRFTISDINKMDPAAIREILQPDCMKALEDGLFKISDINKMHAFQISDILKSDCIQALKGGFFKISDINKMGAFQISEFLKPACIQACIQGLKDGLFEISDINKMGVFQIREILNRDCIRALKNRRFTISDINKMDATAIIAILKPDCIQALEDRRFTISDINKMDPAAIREILQPDCMKALKDRLFTISDINKMDAFQIREFLKQASIQALKDRSHTFFTFFTFFLPNELTNKFKQDLSRIRPQNLTAEQLKKIDDYIKVLENEKTELSNTTLINIKEEHIDALLEFKRLSEIMDPLSSMQQIIEGDARFKHVKEGSRTYQLMNDIINESVTVQTPTKK